MRGVVFVTQLLFLAIFASHSLAQAHRDPYSRTCPAQVAARFGLLGIVHDTNQHAAILIDRRANIEDVCNVGDQLTSEVSLRTVEKTWVVLHESTSGGDCRIFMDGKAAESPTVAKESPATSSEAATPDYPSEFYQDNVL